MRVGMIVNPGAGSLGAMRDLPAVEAFASRYADDVCTLSVAPGDRIEPLARDLAATVDLIIVVGGDGTLNGVVDGVLGSTRPEVAVAFFPSGRGRDTARTLPSISADDLARVNVSWTTQPIDIGSLEIAGIQRRFINIASLGLGATSARIAARLPRLPGTTCYLLGAAAGLMRDRPIDVRLALADGTDTCLSQCRLIAVANGRYFGGGLHIAPNALPDDGLLDIVTVSGASRLDILRNLPRVFSGAHMSHPAVRHWRTSAVTITADAPLGVEADGEVVGTIPATISVQSRALTWAWPA